MGISWQILRRVSVVSVLTLPLLVLAGCSKGSLNNPRNAAIPEVIRIVPNSAMLTGGTSVAIIGSGFVRGANVQLGVASCTHPEYISETTLICTTPRHDIARVDVTVTNPNQRSSTLKSSFAFVESTNTAPGYAITTGGGPSHSANRRAVSSIGELGTPGTQSSASRKMVGGLQATF